MLSGNQWRRPPILSLPQTLAGRYVLDRRLGLGTFAETFRATDLATERVVAVKLLREHLADDPVVAARFQNEAQTASTFQHPAVVAVLDHGRDGDALYTVMELVDGGSLSDLIRARAPLSVPDALSLMHGILEALEVIHRNNVVHRDVKPANILLTSDGAVKLGDFGIARAAYAGHLTRTGMTLGTAAYMAPEQALGETVGPAADLYAAGVILFELLTGQLPFPGDDPLQVMYRQVHEQPPIPHVLNPAVPAALSAALLRALDKEPERSLLRRPRKCGTLWIVRKTRRNQRPARPKSATSVRFAVSRPISVRARPIGNSLIAAGVMLMAGVLGLSAFSRGASTRRHRDSRGDHSGVSMAWSRASPNGDSARDDAIDDCWRGSWLSRHSRADVHAGDGRGSNSHSNTSANVTGSHADAADRHRDGSDHPERRARTTGPTADRDSAADRAAIHGRPFGPERASRDDRSAIVAATQGS